MTVAAADIAGLPPDGAPLAVASGFFLVPPVMHLSMIELEEANRLLIAWGHRMGPCRRPNSRIWAHAMFMHGEPVAVTVTAALIRETCAGLTRGEAVELARVCAGRPHINRAMLRLWREAVLPPLCRSYGWTWAVSYQDEAHHTGNTYRFDGWTPIARSSSGTDQRTGRKGRSKTIWAWRLPEPGSAA